MLDKQVVWDMQLRATPTALGQIHAQHILQSHEHTHARAHNQAALRAGGNMLPKLRAVTRKQQAGSTKLKTRGNRT